MTNHPNRSRAGNAARNPTPTEVRAGRETVQVRFGLGITAAQIWCAEQVHTTCRVWQQWEAEPETPSHRRMHPAMWELFRIKSRT
ncbi:MAG: hypothetical protein NTW90_06820 [Nitrosospira sp.]|nr:hypothetical protein [Nitrosospira sp.]